MADQTRIAETHWRNSPPAGATDEVPGSLPVLRFSSFDRDSVVHGITTRTPQLPMHGNMSFVIADDPEIVRENRVRWAESIGYHWDRLVLGRQVHETTVAVVDESHAGRGARDFQSTLQRVDALVTATPGVPIGVMAADCVPLLLHDPRRQIVAAVHSGWRGTVDGIITETIQTMRGAFGTDPADIFVGVGPSICQYCYQVGSEVVERWNENPQSGEVEAISTREDGYYFDLRAANQVQLIAAGVRADQIERSPVCTRCSRGTIFSRRGLGPKTGLFASVIMLSD